ncbi:Carboxylic ester hydrolase [Meloidogyne graminicola]|uniref:Carboxylic ester hydrolase n=1 Tax=Meloidogyne graminicola TaxID=189291 RepID=A0A8S9ZIT2_9BILA|nr:Carboxylic ester hydrolase [Meloidogyne graminicola]
MKFIFLLFFLLLLINQQLTIETFNNSDISKKSFFDWIFHRHRHHSKNETENKMSKCPHCKNISTIINLTGGKIEGRISNVGDKPSIVFEGIPFAEPPLGNLRFSPLKPKKPWKGILSTKQYSAACLSNSTRTRSPQEYISEDCIYTNVFTSLKCLHHKKDCPVLFYIHGGSFVYDSATMFNETEIVQKYSSDDIVFVVSAYRLGIFGLLDLGNDKTVKRNMAMHDIIFALEWVQKEIHNFAMGNSAGASALSFLCVSPAVKHELFQRAFISSAFPSFVKDSNLNQSLLLLEHFNCLRDNSTNKTFSDQQKVECLRNVDSFELLRQQQHFEDFHIIFNGPGIDTEILPFDNFAHSLRNWKPCPLIYSTTTVEFDRWSEDDKLDKECYKATHIFGYYSPEAYNACFDRYKEEFNKTIHMRVVYESMHSQAFLTSLVNTRFGGISYVGEFEIADHSNHADDMAKLLGIIWKFFFFGLHPFPLNRTDLKLMYNYYPKMVKNFVRGHSPDKDWRSQNWNGRNYFRITFNVSNNNKIEEFPHSVDGYQDVKGLDFWLHDMPIIERKARRKAENNLSGEVEEENNWIDLFGNKKEINKFEERIKHFLPIIGPSFAVLPEDGEEENDTEIIKNENKLTYTDLNNQSNNKEMFKKLNYEFGNVWTAFWILMSITVLLAIVLLIISTGKFVYQYKNGQNGYSQIQGGDGIFTEKSRIITANRNNYNTQYSIVFRAIQQNNVNIIQIVHYYIQLFVVKMKFILLFFLLLLINQQLTIETFNNSDISKKSFFDWIFHRHRHHNKTNESENKISKCPHCKNISTIISLTGGKIEGRLSNVGDKPSIVFEGIPFAEPPLGNLRFSPLKPKKPWKGILSTKQYSAACLSNSTRTRSPQEYISEDCIYTNVFTSIKCLHHKKDCPVLFYIHGGGFVYDSATMFNETEIVQKYSSDDIIFVVSAYRLGIFGLLDLGNDKTSMFTLTNLNNFSTRSLDGTEYSIQTMGNSAGASALTFLCVSPAVRHELFQQAFISSGVPLFRKDSNLNQSLLLLEHFNCLQDNSTNKTFSDQQKVECLRNVDSFELLRQQQHFEDFHIIFNGPGIDTEILPFDNFVHSLRNWKPRNLIYSTTTLEFDRWTEDDRLDKECYKATHIFGYYSSEAYNACFDRYKEEFNKTINMRVTYESMHSESFLTSLVNTRFGGISYVGEFEIADHSNHADDMFFFLGLHPFSLNRTDLKLMYNYYPKMVKNFIRGHSPDKDWKSQNWNGRNYFRITFNVSNNNKMEEFPHSVDGYQDVKGLDFWLHDMPIIERKARRKAENNLSGEVEEENNWIDLFGNKKEINKFEERIKHFLPIIGSSFAVLPEDGEEENDTENIKNENKLTSTDLNNQSNNKEMFKKLNYEFGNVWTAFWILMSITVLLAIVLLIISTGKFVYQYKNGQNGYSQIQGGDGIFTEKSRIITANRNNYNTQYSM